MWYKYYGKEKRFDKNQVFRTILAAYSKTEEFPCV
jgi:hypothetical protein